MVSVFSIRIQVVFGPSTIPTSSFTMNTYIDFVLTSPIVWDGISNMVIEWSQVNPSQISNGCPKSFFTHVYSGY